MRANMFHDAAAQKTRILGLQVGGKTPAVGGPQGPPRIMSMLAVAATREGLERRYVCEEARKFGASAAMHTLGEIDLEQTCKGNLKRLGPLKNIAIKHSPKMGIGWIFKRKGATLLQASQNASRRETI